MADEIATYGDGEGGGFDARAAAAEVSARRAKDAPVTEVTFRDGRSAPDDMTLRQAGAELEKYRVSSDQVDNRPIEEIKYPEDDPKFEQRTAREAAQDLSDYRAALAAQLDGEAPTAEQQQPQPAEPQQAEPAADQQQAQQSVDDLLALARTATTPEQIAEIADKTKAARVAEIEQVSGAFRELRDRFGADYNRFVAQAGNITMAALGAELQGLTTEDLADLPRLAQRDPGKYERLQRLSQTWREQQAMLATQQRASQEAHTREWNSWAAQQDALAAKAIPEAAELQAIVPEVLTKDYGFQAHELAAAYSGAAFSLRDARVQRLIADGVKYRQASKSINKPIAKQVPRVQRPGASQPYAPTETQDLRGLESHLTKSGSLKSAASLLIARRSRSR